MWKAFVQGAIFIIYVIPKTQGSRALQQDLGRVNVQFAAGHVHWNY